MFIKNLRGILSNSSAFRRVLYLLAFLFFLILLCKNPFSERNLIGNLEPFPDTFHYLLPSLNIASGGAFKLVREGRIVNPSVPPFYSIFLIPFYVVYKDIRMFFLGNVALSIISFYFFLRLADNVSKNIIFKTLILFLFSANFFLYWYLQWAMAENMILPLFILSMYLLSKKSLKFSESVVLCLMPGLVYATKYAYLPFSAALFVLSAVKIFSGIKKKTGITKVKTKIVVFALSNIVIFSSVFFYQYVNQKTNIPMMLYNLMSSLLSSGSKFTTTGSSAEISWLSASFFKNNFLTYASALLGNPVRLLWDFTPIVQRGMGIISLTGLLLGMFFGKNRFLSFSLVCLLFVQLISASFFYSVDLRYVYHAIPTLIIGCLIFIEMISNTPLNRYLKYFGVGTVLFFSLTYFVNSFPKIKLQVVLNLRYAETPWYYIAAKRIDSFFFVHSQSVKEKPYLISPLPPYLLDVYSRKNYTVLPLSKDQEFRSMMRDVWGDLNYDNLGLVYKGYLLEGKEVYYSNAGVGNGGIANYASEMFAQNFSLEEVDDGCYGSCKIFKLGLKNSK